jgi:hypothetical protein
LRPRGSPDGAELHVVPAEGGRDRKVTDLQPMRSIAHFYDVSPRGEVVYVQFKAGKRDLWLADAR